MLFELGLIRDTNNKVIFEMPSFERTQCDCRIASFLCFYVTYLGKDCRSDNA
jgi:hypothetical protein